MKNSSFPLSQPLVAELRAVSDGVISAKWPLISGVGLLLRGFTSIETFSSSKHPLTIIIFRTCADLCRNLRFSPPVYEHFGGGGGTF